MAGQGTVESQGWRGEMLVKPTFPSGTPSGTTQMLQMFRCVTPPPHVTDAKHNSLPLQEQC